MFKTVKIFALVLISLILLVLFLRPVIRHEAVKNHWIKIPSIIPAQNWERFSSVDGKFSALFPGIPESTNMFLKFSTINMEMRVFYVNANIENSFCVGYGDSPIFTNKEIAENPQAFLKKSQGIIISNEMARVVFQQEAVFGNYPAREFEYAAGGKANYSVRVKWILVGSRIYQIYVVFLTANPHTADRDVFFNSFRLQN
jgi:hypothetical protein